MSQSDYIAHKKNAHILRKYKDNLGNVRSQNLTNVLESQQLTGFKTFALSNAIYDKNLTYNELLPAEKQRVFGMEMDVSGICPIFSGCKNTDVRDYRILQTGNMTTKYNETTDRMEEYPRTTNYTTSGNSTSKDGYFWHLKTREKLCLEKEFKDCDEYYYRRRIWFQKKK